MKATIQVWAKGFDVRGKTEEFGLIVPNSSGELEGIELGLVQFERWGALIEPLYKLGSSTISRQFVALFTASEFLVASVSLSTDRHGRRSIVLVGAAVRAFDWREPDLADLFSRAHALSLRLSERYGKTMSGAPEEVRQQLRAGGFLPDRGFDLGHEKLSRHVDWDTVAHEVRRWKGVTGIATPALADIGANVLYGTRDEVERGRTKKTVAAFDVARGKIEPTTEGALELWHQPTDPVAIPKKEHLTPDGVQKEPIEELNRNVLTLIDAIVGVRDTLLDLFLPEDSRREKRKRKR